MVKLNLRSLKEQDIPLFARWLQEKHVAPWYEHPEDWLHEIQNRAGEYTWIHHFIAVCDGVDVGFGQYYPYWKSGEDWQGSIIPSGTYSIDYMIGERAFLGKGLGCELVRQLLAAVWAEPDARRVIVQPEPDNAASCNTLLSAGLRYDEVNRLYRLERENLR